MFLGLIKARLNQHQLELAEHKFKYIDPMQNAKKEVEREPYFKHQPYFELPYFE